MAPEAQLPARRGPRQEAGMSTDQFLGPSAAARELGVSYERVRRLMADGRLSFVPTPLGRLVERSSVEAMAAQRSAKAL